jgi:replicative DNA helicase
VTTAPDYGLHSEEAERGLLGAILIVPEGYVLEDFLTVPVEAYWVERHRIIATAVRRLVERNEGVDMATVTEYLRRAGQLEAVGSIAYIMGLGQDVLNTEHSGDYARLILDHARRRLLVAFAGDTIRYARDLTAPITEVLGRVEQQLTVAARNADQGRSVDAIAAAALAVVEPDQGVYFRTGIPTLDQVVGGLKGLVVLGARPSMGKSSLARDIARYQHEQGRKVAFFSQDQHASDLYAFEACLRIKHSYQSIKDGTAGRDAMQRYRNAVFAIREAFRETFQVDDRPHNVHELANRIRAAARWGAELVVVDYLQLIDVPGVRGDNIVQATSHVSKMLKHLTQELELPILALAQLSRNVEARNPPRPLLSDLRESGQIEQDAETVIFLYREEYYRARAEGRSEAMESYADLIVSKNKTGPTGTARVLFTSKYVTFRPVPGLPT